MEGSAFDEVEFFRAIDASGCRALLIGRQALVVLGLPVLTADYDFWIHADDAALLNGALKPFGFAPSRTPEEALRHGRYTLENDEKVDVRVARAVPCLGGGTADFDDVWERRQATTIGGRARVALPSLDDLIATKRFGARPRDAEDIRLLEGLRRRRAGELQ